MLGQVFGLSKQPDIRDYVFFYHAFEANPSLVVYVVEMRKTVSWLSALLFAFEVV